MEIKQNQKLFPLFFAAGVLLLAGGLSLAYINSRFNIISGVLTLMGLTCLVFSLFVISASLRRLFENLKPESHGRFCSIIILLVTILVSVNFLAAKYNFRFDLTKTRQHTLSDETKQIISCLKQNVTVTAFHVGLPPQYLIDLLKEYERNSHGRITTEIADPLVQIGYAAQFGNVISGEEKKAIVKSGKERKDIDFTKEPLGEEGLTNTIVKVTRQKRNIYFLTGHNENNISDQEAAGYSILKNSLENSNAAVHALMLASEKKIPVDCDVLVIAGAQKQLTKDEDGIIQGYLQKGGKALFLIEATPVGTKENPLGESDKLKNPSLNNLLNPWGIQIGDDVVVDLENFAGTDVGCPVTHNYPPHKQIINGLDYTFYIRPRSITVLPDHAKNIKIAPLVYTTSAKGSWAETDKNLKVHYDEGIDIPGPVTIAAVIWEPKNEKKTADTKIIVFTDSDFATNSFINQYSNADIILNSISWLSELENIISIENKKVSVERLDLSDKQKRLVVVVLVLMPILIAGCGGLVWWKQNTRMSD